MDSTIPLQPPGCLRIANQSPEVTAAIKRFFLEHPPIASQLPIVFADGQKCTEYFGICNICKAEIGGDRLRGKVTELTATVLKIEAVALCERCHHLTSSLARVRAMEGNIQLELKTNTGEWLKATALTGLVDRIRSFFFR